MLNVQRFQCNRNCQKKTFLSSQLELHMILGCVQKSIQHVKRKVQKCMIAWQIVIEN